MALVNLPGTLSLAPKRAYAAPLNPSRAIPILFALIRSALLIPPTPLNILLNVSR